MKAGISRVPVEASMPDMSDVVAGGAKESAGGWQDIASRVSTYVSAPHVSGPTGQHSLKELSGLLRLQLDVTQYQLRVEVVSKVAESAVASMRKLQQNQ